ncbi:MAG: glycoside hydrolase, partial [Bacteroidales bacterium]|nr:glycoside hydrolase [Bacteroidales bacterium]
MKKIILLITATCLMGFVININAQTDNQNKQKKEEVQKIRTEIDNIHYWTKLAEKGLVPYNATVPFKPAEEKGSQIITPDYIANSPDVVILDITNNTQSENSVFIDPNDNSRVFNSNNSEQSGSIYGANYVFTDDYGLSWTGSKYGAGGSNSGDPAACIGLNGRSYDGFIYDNGQAVAYSDNETSWTRVVVGANPGYYDLLDKNHLWIDNTNSAYEGNVYDAWTRFDAGHANDNEIEFSRSTNDGVNWSSPFQISSNVSAGNHNQGVNIQCNNTGWVFATWVIYDNWSVTDGFGETAIGFARSPNGGSSFYNASRIHNNIKGIRPRPSTATTNPTGKNMRVNSFPSMAIDVSGGAYHGHQYIVWANVGVPGTNTGTNVSVYCMVSENGGTAWNTPVRVNTVASSDKCAFFPWITSDPVTGNLYCIFYDDRAFSTSSGDLETWMAYSNDGGTTWADFRVSDVSFTPAPIPGLATGYMGDYLGIAARDGWVYPTWTDNRSGRALSYVSPLNFGGNCVASGGCYEHISNVDFGSINNSSTCDGYNDYRSLSNSLAVNGTETISVTNGVLSYPSDQCGMWVDWNDDGDFYDANETITVSNTPSVGPYTADISPPAGQPLGDVTLRIRITYTGSVDPCGNTSFGEVEDYTIYVTPAAPNQWTGTINSDWSNTGNWSLGHVPTQDEDVNIYSSAPNMPIMYDGTTAFCKNLTINSGATLDMQQYSYFDVYGSFNSDYGTFTQTGICYLYFSGSGSYSWDDDNEDDTYTYIRVDKDDPGASVYMWQDMTVANSFEVREGIFMMDPNVNWTLTVNGTGSNAFEVEDGGTVTLVLDQVIDVAGGIEFEDGSQANVTGGTFYCGGNFNVMANAAYDIVLVNNTVVMDASGSQWIYDADGGTLRFHDLVVDNPLSYCYVGPSGGLTVNNDLIITSGRFYPNSFNVTVLNECHVYGELRLVYPDNMTVGNTIGEMLNFYTGSTGYFTNGELHLPYGMYIETGASFTATTGNTIYFDGTLGSCGIINDEPGAVFGNIDVSNSIGTFYLGIGSLAPFEVAGNFTLNAGCTMEMHDKSLHINGTLTEYSTSEILVYNAKKSAGTGKDILTTGNSKGAKGGVLELENDFTLNGLLDVADGDVLLHGDFHIASTGVLDITTGTVIADQAYAKGASTTKGGDPENTKAWQNLYGTINLSNGLFEISHNSMRFGSTSVNNISGGIMRTGFTFSALYAGTFQPTGGIVEFTGTGWDPRIEMEASNYFNDILINRSESIYLGMDIYVQNDLEINSGQLFAYNYALTPNDIYLGGNWTNNAGDAAFDEGTGTVTFNGPNSASVTTTEKFYDLVLDKTYSSYDGLMLTQNVTVVNNTNLVDGTLELDDPCNLMMNGGLIIYSGAGLNANDAYGPNVYIGGTWVNYNTIYSTEVGFNPGSYSNVIFNGGTDQMLMTNAAQEDFNNLTIYKGGGEFRSHDNLQVYDYFHIVDGELNDNVGGLTHTFHGNFDVENTGAYYTHTNPNTAVFAGTGDQTIEYHHIGVGYFRDVIIDKSVKKDN